MKQASEINTVVTCELRRPRLTALSESEVRSFLVRVDEYLRVFKYHAVHTAEGSDGNDEAATKPVPMMAMIESRLLDTILKFELKVDEDKVTDDMLRKYLEGILKSSSLGMEIDWAARLKKKLSIRAGGLHDVNDRLVQVFRDLQVERERCGSPALPIKQITKLIVDCIADEDVRSFVKSQLRFGAEQKSITDELSLYQFLKDKITFFERSRALLREYSSSGKKDAQPSSKSSNKKGSGGQRRSAGDSSTPVLKTLTEDKVKSILKRPEKGCFKCRGDHAVVKCWFATDWEKNNLRHYLGTKEDFASGKRTRGDWNKATDASAGGKGPQQVPQTPRPGYSISSKPAAAPSFGSKRDVRRVTMDSSYVDSTINGLAEDEGSEPPRVRRAVLGPLPDEPDASIPRVTTINGVPGIPFVYDSGAEESIMPLRYAERIGVEVRPVRNVTGFRWMGESVSQPCLGVVSVDILVPTAAGEVLMKAVQAYVVEDADEFLLGMRQLVQLGIHPAQARPVSIVDNVVEDEPELDPMADHDLRVGPDQEDETDRELSALLMRTKMSSPNPSDSFFEGVKALVYEVRPIWRTSFGADPPASVPPMPVDLVPGAVPVASKCRNYSLSQREFITGSVREMERLGLIVEDPASPWASPVHLVRKGKPPEMTWREVVDLREVNKLVLPTSYPIPNLKDLRHRVRQKRYFAKFDLYKGYWQFLMEPGSQRYFCFVVPDGVYRPTRIPMGCRISASWFQYCIEKTLDGLVRVTVLVYIDDILVMGETEEELLRNIREVLLRFLAHGIKLSPKKADLFSTSVEWCGQLISGDGVRVAPSRVEALISLPRPVTAAQLQNMLGAMGWIRDHLPEYARVTQPLTDLLNESLEGLKRSRSVTSAVKLGWTDDASRTFDEVKRLLLSAVELSHPDPEQRLELFTDASDLGWGAILTQVPTEDAELPVNEQRHSPLAFLSGLFKGSSLRWSTCDKEAYAVVAACCKLDYYLLRDGGFEIYTDHRNLTYILGDKGKSPVSRCVADRLERWAVKLRVFEYRVVHVSGSDNVWADLLSRWGLGRTVTVRVTTRSATRQAVAAVDPPESEASGGGDSTDDDDTQSTQPVAGPSETLPSDDELSSVSDAVLDAQREVVEVPEGVTELSGVLRMADGSIWIPDVNDLRSRVLVSAHVSSAGHGGCEAMALRLTGRCGWSGMTGDVEKFVKSCLHCQMGRDGKLIPRPLGTQVRGSRPNEVVHFDYMKVTPASREGFEYVLVLQDDYSGLVDLIPSSVATSKVAADALLRWFASHGVVLKWVSDQGSHFKCQLMEELSDLLGADHHFVTAYSPWANGTVERANKQLLKVLRAVMSERMIPQDEWASIVSVVMHAMNNFPSTRLGGLSAVQVFRGASEDDNVDALAALLKRGGAWNVEEVSANGIKENLAKLRERLDELHRDVVDPARKSRDKGNRISRREARVNFSVGDFVLALLVCKKNKVQGRWSGPFRVVEELSDWVFRVRDIVDESTTRVLHASRLKFYADKDLGVTQSLKDIAAYHGSEYEVEELTAWKTEGDRVFLRVKWFGYDEDEDQTWESFDQLAIDVPAVVREFSKEHQEEHPVFDKFC
eukprot:Rmarinus@m.15248